MTSVRFFAMCGLMLAATGAAQDPKGPAPGKLGELIPATFRSYIVVDDRFPPKVVPPKTDEDRDPKDRTNKMHCLICENGLNPVVAAFVRPGAQPLTAESNIGKLALALNKLLPEYRGDKLAAFIAFLQIEGMPKAVTLTNPDKTQQTVELDAEYPDDEKRDQYATKIRDLASATKASHVVFTLAPVTAKAIDAWGVKAEDEVTVVIYQRLRIAKRWTFKLADGPTDEQIKEIVAATEEMITGVKKK